MGLLHTLVFADFGKHAQPAGGVIAAVPCIFMRAKGLHGTGKRKKDNGGGEEGSKVELNSPNNFHRRWLLK